MTNDYKNNDNKKTGLSQSTLKRRGRPQGFKVSEATRAKLKQSRGTRGRPIGATNNNVKYNKSKLPSDDKRIKTIWARYFKLGWLVTGYSCNLCDDYYSHMLQDCEQHVAKCNGLNKQQRRNTKKQLTEELIIRLASGQVVIREETK